MGGGAAALIIAIIIVTVCVFMRRFVYFDTKISVASFSLAGPGHAKMCLMRTPKVQISLHIRGV